LAVSCRAPRRQIILSPLGTSVFHPTGVMEG
jgi:hypothetical protein